MTLQDGEHWARYGRPERSQHTSRQRQAGETAGEAENPVAARSGTVGGRPLHEGWPLELARLDESGDVAKGAPRAAGQEVRPGEVNAEVQQLIVHLGHERGDTVHLDPRRPAPHDIASETERAAGADRRHMQVQANAYATRVIERSEVVMRGIECIQLGIVLP